MRPASTANDTGPSTKSGKNSALAHRTVAGTPKRYAVGMDARRTLLAVHAHPDDECISTGGILARYASENVRTVLVTCTDGAVGEISDPALATPDNLAEVRARELDESVRILRISRLVKLGYRDS